MRIPVCQFEPSINAVAEGFVACRVRSAGNIGPAIRIALEPFALQRCEAANEIPAVRIPGRGRLADKVCSVLVLPRALRGGDLIIPELIYPLACIDAVAIRGSQGMVLQLGGTLRGPFENPPQAFFDPFQRPVHLRERRRHSPTRRILAEYGFLSVQIFCLHLASPE